MADEGALNEVLDRLRGSLDALKEGVQALIDKVSTLAAEVDLSDEIARVEALVAEIGDVTAQITATLTPVEPPVEEPPVEEPPVEEAPA